MDIVEQIASLRATLEQLPGCKDGASLKQIARVAMGLIAEIEENPELEQLVSAKDKDRVIASLRTELKNLQRDKHYEIEDMKSSYEERITELEEKIKNYEETIKTLENEEVIKMSEKVDDLLSKDILDKIGRAHV